MKGVSLFDWCIENNRQDLIDEWDYIKNPDIKTVSKGSSKKYWWVCSKGHHFEAAPANRTNKDNLTSCPYCSNKKVLQGYNDLVTLAPNIAKEWNYDKNGNERPESYTLHSGKVFWWKCNKGHEWQASIDTRTKCGCPYCSNKKVLIGFNDLTTTHPGIAKEWNYKRNGNLHPEDVVAGSNKKVWWICDNGHEWITSVYSRTSGNNCPICSKQKIVAGINDLETTNKDYCSIWDYAKNDITPKEVASGSDKKVWWICKEGHSYLKSINARLLKPIDYCPICNAGKRENKRCITGVNDLLTLNPTVAAEWNYEKNGDLLPSNVTAGSGKIVWWKCSKCGYEWQASISNRNSKSNKTGCPKCSLIYQASVPEKAIYYYIKRVFPDARENNRLPVINNKELDVYIPSLNIGIEYDGGKWHQNIEKDIIKDKLCLDKGITLIRIREDACPKYDSSAFIIDCGKPRASLLQLNEPIKNLLQYMSKKFNVVINIEVDISKDYPKILDSINYGYKLNIKNPVSKTSLIDEWNYDKNISITPDGISSNSNRKVWWKCKVCGHEWLSTVNNRNNGQGCPICGRKRAYEKHRKIILNIDTGEIFLDISEASLKHNISVSTIRGACIKTTARLTDNE